MQVLHRTLDACSLCPNMVGPVVHGPPVDTDIFLLGQAPGPHEGTFGRPFAWTAGKTLFRWFHEAMGIDESTFREHIYMSAVARCFPGKANGGGDRKPDKTEIANCVQHVRGEVSILKPQLVIPVGSLAIEQVLGRAEKLAAVIGTQQSVRYHGVRVDVIALPHPSGASTWHRMEPGKFLLGQAMKLLANHASMKAVISKTTKKSLPAEPKY
jgi:uracil-DNA glycosylase